MTAVLEERIKNLTDKLEDVVCSTKETNKELNELVTQHKLMIKECDYRRKENAKVKEDVIEIRKQIQPLIEILNWKKVTIAIVTIIILAASLSTALATLKERYITSYHLEQQQ
jgi:hypothetical protein